MTEQEASASEQTPIDPLTLELNSVFHGLARTSNKAVQASLARLGLTPARVAVISILHRHPDRKLTVGEIATGLHVSSTNISRRLDGLERTGWVRRERNPDDGRSIYIALTEQGRERADAVLPGIYRGMNDAWSIFSESEKRELLRLLNRMLERTRSRGPLPPLAGK